MAFAQDLLTRIVNVQWGVGKFFAAGTVLFTERYNLDLRCSYSNEKTGWQSSTLFHISDHVFDLRCGVYGNPTTDPIYILAGNDTDFSDEDRNFIWTVFIVTSTDGGQSWIRTYTKQYGFAQVAAYDKEKQLFYVQCTDNTGRPGTVGFDSVVLSSSDGQSWSEIDRVSHPPGEGGDYASPIILAACSEIYKDADGRNCPGGIYGYDKANRIVIAPYPDIRAYIFSQRDVEPQIQIFKYDIDGNLESSEINSIAGLGRVASVTFAGGVWMASGHDGNEDQPAARIFSSKDKGQTWEQVNEHSASSITMIVLGASP